MACRPRGWGYLPIVLVVLAIATFITTYIIAVVRGDVLAYFPYISDTGTRSPESCIFGLALNICAGLAIGTMFIRYKLVAAMTNHQDTKHRRLNKAGMILGIFTSFGLCLVANFQETNIEPVHVTGAFLVFGIGVVYGLTQAALSYSMHPEYHGIHICRTRMALSILSFAGLIITTTGAIVSRMNKDPNTDRFHWKPDEPAFVAHVVSTIGEWVTAIVFLCFFLTFVPDFSRIEIDVEPRINVVMQHVDHQPFVNERTPLMA